MTNGHVLCTGGAGYIGSHTVLHLLKAGFKVTILDNLSNASAKVVDRLEEIAGQTIPFANVDLTDKQALRDLFHKEKFDAVIHYAALKAVGESVAKPLKYYRNNVVGSLNLFEVMDEVGCKVLVFSSSATVYQPKAVRDGHQWGRIGVWLSVFSTLKWAELCRQYQCLICGLQLSYDLIKEDDPLGPSNPYGQSKLFVEQMLRDLYVADRSWKISLLRYFNPVGAHPSGRIGESPEEPANLLPYIQQVAVGRRDCLRVFGNDWETRDGTGVRDYIHIEDLAEGHIAALNKLNASKEGMCIVHNLGTGKGVSVLEMAKYFEKASGKPIPLKIVERRPGDLASVVADPSKANKELNWKATRTIEDGCASAWKWQSLNPYGYEEH